ncbi:MAG: ribulose-phosphate 3-epimerase [Solirubrobacteraceae bacterium]
MTPREVLMGGGPRIAPSILSADFARLGAQVGEVMAAGARAIHVDGMDGHFVPPITIGPLIVGALADQVHEAGGALDVHLMIERPEAQIAEFARAGADSITFHLEATAHVHRTLGAVRAAGCVAGVAINPGTPVGALESVASELDLALCMSVNPGWGGQAFIPASLERLRRLRELVPATGAVEVDGGVDMETAGPCAGAGASLLVAGSAVFGSPDPGEAYSALVEAAEPASRAGQ